MRSRVLYCLLLVVAGATGALAAESWDKDLAVKLATCIAISHCPHENVETWTCKACVSTGLHMQRVVTGLPLEETLDNILQRAGKQLKQSGDVMRQGLKLIAYKLGQFVKSTKSAVMAHFAKSSPAAADAHAKAEATAAQGQQQLTDGKSATQQQQQRFRSLRAASKDPTVSPTAAANAASRDPVKDAGDAPADKDGGGAEATATAKPDSAAAKQAAKEVEKDVGLALKDMHVRVLHGHQDVRMVLLDNNADTVYIIFKGTEELNLPQWLGDFALRSVDVSDYCAGCRAHHGFWMSHKISRQEYYLNFKEVYDKLKLRVKQPKIVIAGHSLGGPMASLFAIYITAIGYEPTVVYTFGSPRWANGALAAEYNKRIPSTFRVVHGLDLAPQVPPTQLGYKHTGVLAYCPGTGPECELMPGVETAPAMSHKKPHIMDHGSYMGVVWFSFMSIGKRDGCANGAAAPTTTATATTPPVVPAPTGDANAGAGTPPAETSPQK